MSDKNINNSGNGLCSLLDLYGMKNVFTPMRYKGIEGGISDIVGSNMTKKATRCVCVGGGARFSGHVRVLAKLGQSQRWRGFNIKPKTFFYSFRFMKENKRPIAFDFLLDLVPDEKKILPLWILPM